jgi:hypothetical protein
MLDRHVGTLMFPVNATAKSEIGRTGLRNTLFYQTTGKSSAVTAHTGNNMLEYIKMLVNFTRITKSLHENIKPNEPEELPTV